MIVLCQRRVPAEQSCWDNILCHLFRSKSFHKELNRRIAVCFVNRINQKSTLKRKQLNILGLFCCYFIYILLLLCYGVRWCCKMCARESKRLKNTHCMELTAGAMMPWLENRKTLEVNMRRLLRDGWGEPCYIIYRFFREKHKKIEGVAKR